MNELVSSKSIDASHVAPNEGEDKPVEYRIPMSVLEQESIGCAFQGIDLTDYAKTPEPI